MAKIIVRSAGQYRTEISARHHKIYADEPVADGGSDSAPTPMELAQGALGACIAITVQLYAQRKGWPLESIEVAVEQERFKGSEYPAYQGDSQYVHEVRNQIVLRGPLSEEQRQRLLEIAGKCPVHRLIESPAFFVDTLIEAEALSAE